MFFDVSFHTHPSIRVYVPYLNNALLDSQAMIAPHILMVTDVQGKAAKTAEELEQEEFNKKIESLQPYH